MSNTKKTCKVFNISKSAKSCQIKTYPIGKNKTMKEIENENCKIHLMPTQISDDDISALFNGLLKVVKKKFELDKKAEIVNSNLTNEKLLNELKSKDREIIKLKNEIIYLKSEIEKNKKSL